MKKPNKNNPKQGAKAVTQAEIQTSAVASSSSPSVKVVVKEVGTEPTVRRNSIPVILIAVLGAALYWGNMYIVEHGGELDARVHAPYANWKQIEGLKPQDANARRMANGLRVYSQYCASCHGGDGAGNASSGFPPLAKSDWVLVKDPSRIIRIVLNGLGGPITVNGKEYGQAVMLPWRDALNDQDIADVVSYVRNTWGNKAPMVDPAAVKPIRDQTADKGGNWTAAELLQIPLKD